MVSKTLLLILLTGSVAMVGIGQLYEETYWKGPVTVVGQFGVGGAPEKGFDLEVSIIATYPVNFIVYTWPRGTPNSFLTNPLMSVLMQREGITEVGTVITIPDGVLWEVLLTNVGDSPNPVDLTVRKDTGLVKAALTFPGLVLAGISGSVALVSRLKRPSPEQYIR